MLGSLHCLLSSAVEHSPCKRAVNGSIPLGGSLGSDSVPGIGVFAFRRGSAPRFRIPDGDRSQVSETGELIESTGRIDAPSWNLRPVCGVWIPTRGVDSRLQRHSHGRYRGSGTAALTSWRRVSSSTGRTGATAGLGVGCAEAARSTSVGRSSAGHSSARWHLLDRSAYTPKGVRC